MSNPILYIMGVSGSGKTTIGKMLSEKTGIPFFDGDDFHPVENIQKMASGQPLDDEDRQGWLLALNNLAKKEKGERGAIIACSALKGKYREILKKELGANCFIIFLNGTFATIENRLQQRGGHFMPTQLLQSQFDALQPPEDAFVFDIINEPAAIVDAILLKLTM
jgi:carbohydrate kinase (thermoresistant glucokinase family)